MSDNFSLVLSTASPCLSWAWGLLTNFKFLAFKIAEKFCQVWDYIGITWDLFLTKHWEITLFVKEFQVLSKAIRPLPEKFHGVTDQETIYRQRYLDLIMNDESYEWNNFMRSP